MSIKRISHEDLQIGDIIGISYAQNEHLFGKSIFEETLGRYLIIEHKRCLMVQEQIPNWFHTIFSPKPVCMFGSDMFFKLEQ